MRRVLTLIAPLMVGTVVLAAIALLIGIISQARGNVPPDFAFTSAATTVNTRMDDEEVSEPVIYRDGLATRIADFGKAIHFLGWSPDSRVASYAATQSCFSCAPLVWSQSIETCSELRQRDGSRSGRVAAVRSSQTRLTDPSD